MRFLDRNAIWREIDHRVPTAKKTMAAVAYVGANGASYLPLKEGDVLVVDMSLRAVRQGVTDPKEIRKLLKKKVEVYTREKLHAKLLVIDNELIVSSANASTNARKALDEAGVLIEAPRVVSKARAFIEGLCVEPILPGYLEECIREYRPPRFKAARTARATGKTGGDTRVWFLAGLRLIDVTKDQSRLEKIEAAAEKELSDPLHQCVSWIRYSRRPKFFDSIARHDWVVDCMRTSPRTQTVGPPCRVMRKSQYTSAGGRKYHLLLLESPSDGEEMSLSAFRKAVGRLTRAFEAGRLRSMPIGDLRVAEGMLRIWNSTGHIRRVR